MAGLPPGTKGGGHKRLPMIDFRRNDKDGVNAKVIEYDPELYRTDCVAPLSRWEKRTSLHSNGLRKGMVESGANADITGQQPAIAQHPGRYLDPRRGSSARRWRWVARSAGSSIQLLGKAPATRCRVCPAVRFAGSTPAAARPSAAGNAEQANTPGQGRLDA